MSRPRTPFGAERPGRLAATMIRVLAAEMSDPGRLSRGKQYWSTGAVVDIVVGHGAVTAEVQGSRPLPYVVTIEARPGHRAPARRDITVRCTCPDDDGTGQWACKHAVAALFALSDEVAIEPEVLARWRRSDTVPDTVPADTGTDAGEADRPADTSAIAALLAAPSGRELPDLPVLTEAVHPRVPDDLVADVLDDAVSHLRIRWE